MNDNAFVRANDSEGYVVAWKYKYDFKAGKYADEVMTYGEAKARAEKLGAEKPEMTFWPEKAKRAPSKFDAHSQE